MEAAGRWRSGIQQVINPPISLLTPALGGDAVKEGGVTRTVYG